MKMALVSAYCSRTRKRRLWVTEFYRDEIANARLVAGTGCNSHGQFILRPLLSADVIDTDDIILINEMRSFGGGQSAERELAPL